LAIPASKVKEGIIMQLQAYRGPEVDLGHPISEAIDICGLRCVMARYICLLTYIYGNKIKWIIYLE